MKKEDYINLKKLLQEMLLEEIDDLEASTSEKNCIALIYRINYILENMEHNEK